MIKIDVYYSDNAGDPDLTYGDVEEFYEALKSKPPFGKYDEQLSVNMIKCDARFGQQSNGIPVHIHTEVMEGSQESVLYWVKQACRKTLLVSCGKKRPIYVHYANTGEFIKLQ